jgi:hypothetical protein
MQTVDFALGRRKEVWLQHPVLGDLSIDSFRRLPGNPICRGRPGLEWPVNGFLFEDPVSGNWFVYVGHYPYGYACGPRKKSFCTVYRSLNRGRTWEHLGPIFPRKPFGFKGLTSRLGSAPDVSVVYDNGRYHMAFDWSTADADWSTVRTKLTGVGYAWSEKPEGPFHREPRPMLQNGGRLRDPILRKYNRFYASTLIRRKKDWLLLTLVDSHRYYAWGLVGFTARNPEGPYGRPTPLFHVEGDTYQPPLMEYFPSFVHDGWVYAPATSVALNRNFQTIHRAPVEDAMRPEAWELFLHGSVWHSEPVEHEAWGIWGQAFSGFVDKRGQFTVMFPSKDPKDRGTINLAARDWDRPWSRRGFVLCGNQGPSLSLLRRGYESFRLECELELTGTAAVLWACRGPLGPNTPKSNSTLHERCVTCCRGLQLTRKTWEVFEIGDRPGDRMSIAAGKVTKPPRRIAVECREGGPHRIRLNGREVWQGVLPVPRGAIGLWAGRASRVAARRFTIAGRALPASFPFLYTEALLGAGQNLADWDEVESPLFRFGKGAAHKGRGGRVKWNFRGTGFVLWAPGGPDYGKMEVLLDGKRLHVVNLNARRPKTSEPVLRVSGLPDTFHAVVVKGRSGRLVVDSLDACTGAAEWDGKRKTEERNRGLHG